MERRKLDCKGWVLLVWYDGTIRRFLVMIYPHFIPMVAIEGLVVEDVFLQDEMFRF